MSSNAGQSWYFSYAMPRQSRSVTGFIYEASGEAFLTFTYLNAPTRSPTTRPTANPTTQPTLWTMAPFCTPLLYDCRTLGCSQFPPDYTCRELCAGSVCRYTCLSSVTPAPVADCRTTGCSSFPADYSCNQRCALSTCVFLCTSGTFPPIAPVSTPTLPPACIAPTRPPLSSGGGGNGGSGGLSVAVIGGIVVVLVVFLSAGSFGAYIIHKSRQQKSTVRGVVHNAVYDERTGEVDTDGGAGSMSIMEDE